jgi:hypothetical protein
MDRRRGYTFLKHAKEPHMNAVRELLEVESEIFAAFTRGFDTGDSMTAQKPLGERELAQAARKVG